MKRFAVLRLVGVDTVYAKEPDSPVVVSLHLLEPLSDAQLRHLAIASPWNPVIVEACMDCVWDGSGFGARINVIETTPKVPLYHPKRRLREGLYKRKRGFLFHDQE
jgi:hypothetical protein